MPHMSVDPDATAERNLRPSTAPALRAPKQCSVPRYHRKGHLGMGHSDVLLPHSADSLVLKMEKQRLQEAKKAFREVWPFGAEQWRGLPWRHFLAAPVQAPKFWLCTADLPCPTQRTFKTTAQDCSSFLQLFGDSVCVCVCVCVCPLVLTSS